MKTLTTIAVASTEPTPAPLRLVLARAMALFFGGFSLLNLLGEWRRSGFDTTLWWLDVRTLPPALSNAGLSFVALCLIAFGIRPALSAWRRRMTVAATVVVLFVALVNSAVFYRLLWRDEINSAVPVPFSLLVAMAFTLILRVALVPLPSVSDRHGGWRLSLALAGCLLVFPVAQMICFGKTDYRRPADVAVVFGARAYADGTLSDALADRVRTGCQLYRTGRVKKLLLSGGPGDGSIHETDGMRSMAISLGVPSDDILLDRAGLNTRATVRNTATAFNHLEMRRIIAVSHFYHLPRIKLAYQRAGLDVFTVPAQERYFLAQIPYSMAREVVALWVYYLRPLAEQPRA